MKFISLFSGAGGMDLGLERAGMECVAQVEIDEFCQKVLTKHWPDVPKFKDVRDVGKENLPAAELICGGFPCQPFSVAGKQRGTEDDRHLWPEMLRVISELKPNWIFGENVPGIIPIFLDQAISDLENEGYKTEQFVIPACAFDAQHRRDRLFIVAYSEKVRSRGRHSKGYSGGRKALLQSEQKGREVGLQIKGCDESLSYAEINIRRTSGNERQSPSNRIGSAGWSRWATEPKLGRVADGVPGRVDRLKSLGNAVVPQVAEFIGRMIMEAHNE